jgi:hypothetical protein
VRMESPLFLLIAVVLLLHSHGRFLAASSLLVGSLLFHPALGLAAVGYAAILYLLPGRGFPIRNIGAMEWTIATAVAACVLCEVFRIAHHWSLFETHMAYQTARKLHSPIQAKLMKPQGVILLIGCVTIATILWRRHTHPKPGNMRDTLAVAGIALGILVYAVLGNEMTYDVYSLSVCPSLVFCLVCRNFDGAKIVR